MEQQTVVEPTTDQTPGPKAYSMDYQATDTDGTPIGNLTHLTADTPEEMFEKMKTAHINALRLWQAQNRRFEELKTRKVTPKAEKTAPAMSQIDEGRYAATISDPSAPPAQKKEAIRQLGGIIQQEDQLQKLEADRAYLRGQQIGLQFQRNHVHDYFPCEANSKALTSWLDEHQLEFELDNLELAFLDIGEKLAKDPSKRTATNAVTNATPINQPIVEENSTPPSETQRRQPNFGIQPGQGSVARPANTTAGKMTKKDVLAKRKADPVWWKKVLNDPDLQKEVNEALARG
jgi:hypothetical protein